MNKYQTLNELQDYYKNIFEEDFSIDFIRFRHFRIVDHNGFFHKIKVRIMNNFQLKDFLIEFRPIHVYYSVGKFLSPHQIGSKFVDKARFLGMDLVFDIDSPNNLAIAFTNLKKIIDYAQKNHWHIKYIAFSGSKGFHIVCDDPFEYQNFLFSSDLETQAISNRKLLVEEMKSKNLNFDFKVTIDSRRILRLPNSVHGKSGFVCQLFSVQEIEEKTFKEIERLFIQVFFISRFKKPTFKSLKLSFLSNDLPYYGTRLLTEFRNRLKVRSKFQHFFSTFFSNVVTRTSLFITILEYHHNSPWNNQLILDLSKEYALGPFYVFEMDKKTYLVNLKPVQEQRLLKILKKANSNNYNQFLNNKKSILNVDLE